MSTAKYTLITGASEGLGKALALECASRNYNLILVALPNSGLQELGAFIGRNFHVAVFTFEEDLTEEASCKNVYARITKMNLAVNMLINNAGLGSTLPFAEGSIELYTKQIKLNILATTLLCRLFINDLVTNGPSYILNVSSMASFFCLPKKLVYGCTKSFILHFSQSLQCEFNKHDISVSVLCPPGLNTNVTITLLNKSGTFFSRALLMNPEQVAPLAIEAMLKGKQVILPGPLCKLYKLIGQILPHNIQSSIAAYNMKRMIIKPQYMV